MNTVYNKYHGLPPPGAVYIGRGSVYGNPYVIGTDGDRDAVCDKFERYVLADPQMVAYIKKTLRGKDLVCFCKPKRCHGDFLLKLANS